MLNGFFLDILSGHKRAEYERQAARHRLLRLVRAARNRRAGANHANSQQQSQTISLCPVAEMADDDPERRNWRAGSPGPAALQACVVAFEGPWRGYWAVATGHGQG